MEVGFDALRRIHSLAHHRWHQLIDDGFVVIPIGRAHRHSQEAQT